MSTVPPRGPGGPGGGPYSNVTRFPKRKRQVWNAFSPAKWQDREPEPVSWIVENCIPRGTVCLFSGDSGLGKSLLMQQLQSCAALGRPWLGNQVARCRSFGFYCEEPENILHLRQKAICASLDCEPADLEDVLLASRCGEDNVLMDFDRRSDEGRVTELYDQILESIREFGTELNIIDTAAHTFAGNENVRSQVTAFVNALQAIANETQGAVVLCSHPSVSSMVSGTGYSGSTAWRATVRAHMYLKRPKGYDDESDESDPNIRVLKTMKANWGPGAGLTRLKWDNGVFVPIGDEQQAVSGTVGRIEIDGAVYEAVKYLVTRGERISAETGGARNNVLFMLSNLPSLQRYKRNDVRRAVDRLLESGRLVRVDLGPRSRRRAFIRTDDTRYPDEPEQGQGG